MMPLATAAAAAGHDVAVCTSPVYAPTIESFGLGHLAAGATSFAELFGEGPPYADVARRTAWVQAVAFATRNVERMVPDLLRHIEDWRPDVVVRDFGEYGGALAAEKRGLPHAAVSGGAWSTLDARRSAVADALDVQRRRLGLPPDPEGRMVFRYLQFAFTPPSWEGEDLVPPVVHHFRYDNPQRPGESVPEWLPRMGSERPLVYVSLGTLHGSTALFRTIVDALADEPFDVVVALGGDHDPAALPEPPANVRVEGFVPQILVLERCDLFVTHGGFNSTKEALRLGVPLIVLPITGDQPYTAQRVAALELGRSIGPDERTAERIRDDVREVLADPRYRDNARRFSEEMQALPPISQAVALLERLAQEGEPIFRPTG